MSLADLAGHDHCDSSYLEKIERAERTIGRMIIVVVPRRGFIQGLGATAAATATGLTTAPSALSPPIPTDRTARLLASKDINAVEHFQQMRKTLIDNDRLFGPWRVIPMVQEQINLLQRLRSNSNGTDQRELLRVQAQYSQFCGGLHRDIGAHPLAESWIDRALGLSHTAGDQNLTAYILTCKAQQAGAMRLPADAIGAGEQALRLAPPHSRIAAAAAMFVGHGYALNGDRTAMERSYDRARETFGTVDADPGCPCGTWFLDETRIALERAQSLAALEDYHSAAQSFQSSILGIPSHFPRGRGAWLSRTSLALANDHEVEHAAALGLEALPIGVETGSGGILTPLVELNHVLARWSTVPAVADFRTAMNDTILHQA